MTGGTPKRGVAWRAKTARGMIPRLACAMLFGVFMLSQAQAAEQLVYAVSTGEMVRFPRVTQTEIFMLDPASKQTRLLFADAGTEVVLLPPLRAGGIPGEVMGAGGGRIFALGMDRKNFPLGLGTAARAVFEVPTKSGGKARKVFDLEPGQASSNFRNLFVSPQGDKIGHVNIVGGHQYVFIHDSASGKLLHRIEMDKIALDCFIRRIGWLPDGTRLRFTLETGDEHVTSEASYGRAGNYTMRNDGTELQRLPRAAWAAKPRPGFTIIPDFPPSMIGRLPDGKYLFAEVQWIQKQGDRTHAFLFSSDAAGRSRRDLVVDGVAATFWFLLSPSGKLLAATELAPANDNEKVWVFNTETGEASAVLEFPTKSLRLPCMNLIGWLPQ